MSRDTRILTDYTGKPLETHCLGCAREQGDVTIGHILKTTHFDSHADFEIPIPGFVIVSSRRHIQSIDEFTEDEKKDFIDIMTLLRKKMREVLDIQTVYLVQEEDTSHHFHFWIFPRYEWMEKQFGLKIQSVRPIMEYAREHLKTKGQIENVHEAARRMKEAIQYQ